MVRVKLEAVNETDEEIPLNFGNMGDLVRPIQATSVSVVKFSIPNAVTPIMEWHNDKYVFTLAYDSKVFSQPVLYQDRGSIYKTIKQVFEIDHVIDMLNITLVDAVAGLNALGTLPSLVAPRLIYNVVTSRYEFIVLASAYEKSLSKPIEIYCNRSLFFILQSLPVFEYTDNSVNMQFKFLFKQIVENTYLTSYIKVTQEAISISSYNDFRTILLTTSMPIESVITCSTTLSANQSSLNVLQTYTIPYTNGIIDNLENLDFSSPADGYRTCKLQGNNLYSVKCDVLYQLHNGTTRPFLLPPYKSAIIELEFL